MSTAAAGSPTADGAFEEPPLGKAGRSTIPPARLHVVPDRKDLPWRVDS